jgi:hypothetical protein
MIRNIGPLVLLISTLSIFGPPHVFGATIGPLPYSSVTDSPFDLSRLGTDFYIETYSTQLARTRIVGVTGAYFTTKFSTPGVSETSGNGSPYASSAGGEFYGISHDIAGSEAVDLSFEFDANELGRLPQAVGFKIANWAPITVNFFAEDGSLRESLFAPTAPLPPGPQPTGLGATMNYYMRFRFLGAIEPEGIARVTVSSPSTSLILGDFQYGQQTPEMTSIYLALAGAYLVSFCLRPNRRRAA